MWNERQRSHLLSQNVFLQSIIYPSEKKKFIGTSSILAWVKVVGCLHYQVFHAKQPWRKLVSGFSFACNKYPPQFTDDKSNDSSMREGIPLDALNWFGRGYELHTPKSVGREGSKAWALSVVPHFSLSPPRLAFLAWGDFHARSSFARSTIPKEKWGLLVVCPDKDFELRTKIEFSRQVRRRQSTGRDSRCFG